MYSEFHETVMSVYLNSWLCDRIFNMALNIQLAVELLNAVKIAIIAHSRKDVAWLCQNCTLLKNPNWIC